MGRTRADNAVCDEYSEPARICRLGNLRRSPCAAVSKVADPKSRRGCATLLLARSSSPSCGPPFRNAAQCPGRQLAEALRRPASPRRQRTRCSRQGADRDAVVTAPRTRDTRALAETALVRLAGELRNQDGHPIVLGGLVL